MLQSGFFDLENRFGKLDQLGDPLKALNAVVEWPVFAPILKKGLKKEKKSNAGRPVTFAPLLMFKVLILQSLYNLADAQTEFQIRDRFTFLRFLGLTPESPIPDEKTIWLFRENLKEHGLYDELFRAFTGFLDAHGFEARQGTVIDARIVEVPKQRNRRSENATIKEGLMPAPWEKQPAKRAQKDIEARWTQKNGKNYYGYKNHIGIDVQHKFIRRYDVTPASVHDSQRFEQLLDRRNSNPRVYADSAYRSDDHERLLKRKGYRNRVHHRIWGKETFDETSTTGKPRPLPYPRPGRTRLRAPGEVDAPDARPRHRAGAHSRPDRARQPRLQHEPLGTAAPTVGLTDGADGEKRCRRARSECDGRRVRVKAGAVSAIAACNSVAEVKKLNF